MSAERYLQAVASISARHRHGMTVSELRIAKGWHHGIASGVLSHLHEKGRLARLAEKRGENRIYVTPEYVAGRKTEKYGRRRRSA